MNVERIVTVTRNTLADERARDRIEKRDDRQIVKHDFLGLGHFGVACFNVCNFKGLVQHLVLVRIVVTSVIETYLAGGGGEERQKLVRVIPAVIGRDGDFKIVVAEVQFSQPVHIK